MRMDVSPGDKTLVEFEGGSALNLHVSHGFLKSSLSQRDNLDFKFQVNR